MIACFRLSLSLSIALAIVVPVIGPGDLSGDSAAPQVGPCNPKIKRCY